MATRIEIIGVSNDAITAAFYYGVPAAMYSAAASDPARIPVGNGLSSVEVQALKDGHLYELVREINPQSMSRGELKAYLEQSWLSFVPVARQEYTRKYSYLNLSDVIGKVWDGTAWT